MSVPTPFMNSSLPCLSEIGDRTTLVKIVFNAAAGWHGDVARHEAHQSVEEMESLIQTAKSKLREVVKVKEAEAHRAKQEAERVALVKDIDDLDRQIAELATKKAQKAGELIKFSS